MKNREESLMEPIIAVALESKYGKKNVASLMEVVNSHRCAEMATQVLLGIAQDPELPTFVKNNSGQICQKKSKIRVFSIR